LQLIRVLNRFVDRSHQRRLVSAREPLGQKLLDLRLALTLGGGQ
jgi:hypothetical protein